MNGYGAPAGVFPVLVTFSAIVLVAVLYFMAQAYREYDKVRSLNIHDRRTGRAKELAEREQKAALWYLRAKLLGLTAGLAYLPVMFVPFINESWAAWGVGALVLLGCASLWCMHRGNGYEAL